MGLQLKGENEKETLNRISRYEEEEGNNPWDYEDMKEEPYQTTVVSNAMAADIHGEERQGNKLVQVLIKLAIWLGIGAVLLFVGKQIVSKVMPEGKDITGLLRSNEAAISAELGVTFTDNSSWVGRIHQYSKGVVRVKAAEDIGIVYIDGKQIGVHIESKAYTMFGVQIGDGEKNAYDNMQFKFDSFLSVLNDMAEGKTTTYYYYNEAQNDCLALTINDTTSRIVGMTYFTDYKKIIETLD